MCQSSATLKDWGSQDPIQPSPNGASLSWGENRAGSTAYAKAIERRLGKGTPRTCAHRNATCAAFGG